MTTALPESFAYGFVVCRIVEAIADTTNDPDRYPEARPAKGKIEFVPAVAVSRTVEDNYSAIVGHRAFVFELGPDGTMLDAHGMPGAWLIQGHWTAKFKIDGLKIPDQKIIVEAGHTIGNPLNLAPGIEPEPLPNVTLRVVEVPAGGATGDHLALAADGGLRWETTGDSGGMSDNEIMTALGGT